MAETPRVLYEDNHILVALKPPNMLSQGDATGDADILTLLKEDLRVRYHKPGSAYLGLVHRLDRPVGGLMVFAKTSKAAARLSAQMREHALGREYLCAAEGGVPDTLALEDWLIKDERLNRVSVCPPDTPGAKRAVLRAECLARREGLSLCAVRLETGRNHQIRVQLAAAGHPLWGDARYGHGRPGQQIALWGYRLTVEHPTTHETLRFQALPEGGVWAAFAPELEALRAETTANHPASAGDAETGENL